jgi:ubiquitin-protein ligase
VLSLSLPISKFLQTKNIDLVEAIQTTNNVVNIIKQLRLNNKSEFKIIFNNVKSKCDALNIEISIPRTTNKQKDKFNIQIDLPEDYYKISLLIPFIDHFF